MHNANGNGNADDDSPVERTTYATIQVLLAGERAGVFRPGPLLDMLWKLVAESNEGWWQAAEENKRLKSLLAQQQAVVRGGPLKRATRPG
jgi:hypothetical protein